MNLLEAPATMPRAILTDSDYTNAAIAIGCEVAAIKAVTSIEAPRGPFQSDGLPTILFERHVFADLTGNVYDATRPDISNKVPGGYGLYSAQYGRLQAAYALNPNAALQSASWGAFQIMGENYTQAGFESVETMVEAMRTGVGAHLAAFVSFIKNDPILTRSIVAKNWAQFAEHYNGPGYAKNGYDVKLAAAYHAIG